MTLIWSALAFHNEHPYDNNTIFLTVLAVHNGLNSGMAVLSGKKDSSVLFWLRPRRDQ